MSEIRIITIVSHLSNSNCKKYCNLTKQKETKHRFLSEVNILKNFNIFLVVLKFYIYEKYNTNKGHTKISFKILLFGKKQLGKMCQYTVLTTFFIISM